MTREYINPPGVPQRVHYPRVLKIDKPSKLIYIAGQTPADDNTSRCISATFALNISWCWLD
jgi:hypothetical protein